MSKPIKQLGKKIINGLLSLANLKLVRLDERSSDYRDFIPFQNTLAQAEAAGLSVGDYIDMAYNVPGSTQETIDQMVQLGVFSIKIDRVCEIGPGSGRYLEKVLSISKPTYYEIYETANDWERWLVQKYQVIPQPSDGMTLAHTPDHSIDLVHAHKVLPGQPTLVICRYFGEMARVVRNDGKVVFDIVTEECLNEKILAEWFKSQSGYQHYPCLMPKQYAIDFFCRRGFSFDGDFFISMKPGITQYLVFTKK